MVDVAPAEGLAVSRLSLPDLFGRDGSRPADLGMTQQLIAESKMDGAATRALLPEARGELHEEDRAPHTTSITKTCAGEALHQAVDRAVPMCRSLGVSRDLPVARTARENRPFRMYDGRSEVHHWPIATRALRRIAAA